MRCSPAADDDDAAHECSQRCADDAAHDATSAAARSNDDEWDAVVVGNNIGSTAAILATAGKRVLVCERTTGPAE